MDALIRLPDGGTLCLEATCRPCSAGWVYRADADRAVAVPDAVAVAGGRHAALVLEYTGELLDHLAARRDEAEQEPEHGEAARAAERLAAAELRLGQEFAEAVGRLGRRSAA
jgi:hypothetical protein